MSEITCPHCGQQVGNAPHLLGQTVACPRCNRQFMMPGQAAPTLMSTPISSSFQKAASQRFKPATSIFDVFDLRFETYVTPIIIRTTWVLFLIAAAIYLLQTTYESFIPAFRSTRSVASSLEYEVNSMRATAELASNRWISTLTSYAIRLLTLSIALLWVRVCLETTIVIFNIATSLHSIDQKTKQ